MKCVFQMDAFCRLCLDVDVKVHKIDTAHVSLIENICKLKAIDIPCADHYVCSICLALLSKTSNFVQMILNAQKLLDDLLKTTDVITKPMLKSIDRHIKGLNPLTVRSFGIFDEDKQINGFYQKDNNQNTNQNKSVAIEKSNQSGINKKCIDKNKSEHNTNNEDPCIEITSNSDEDIIEPHVNICLETNLNQKQNTISKNNKTIATTNKKSKLINNKNLPKKTSECNKLAPRKITVIDPESSYSSETEDSSSCKKFKRDADYEPDSTSHSEDSDFDSYDDEGKQIKKPKYYDRAYPKKCEQCDYEVVKSYDHYRHYQYAHPDAKYPYAIEKVVCPLCGKLVAHNRRKTHESKHELGRYKCPQCPKVFTCKFFVNKHKYNVHRDQVFTCDYCSKSFKTRSDLMRHIRIHTMDKPFKCHICGAGFAHSGNRIIHIRSAHQNIKYVPKKRKQNKTVRRNKKYDSIDTDTESSGEEASQLVKNKRKISVKRNSKKQTQSETEIKSTSKKKSRERKKNAKIKLQNKSTRADTSDVKQNNNRKSKKRKVPKCSDDNYTENYMNSGDEIQIQKRSKTGQSISNFKNDNNRLESDDDSDDECLAEMKKKRELECNQIAHNEEKDDQNPNKQVNKTELETK